VVSLIDGSVFLEMAEMDHSKEDQRRRVEVELLRDGVFAMTTLRLTGEDAWMVSLRVRRR
jgi:hypothetical protein